MNGTRKHSIETGKPKGPNPSRRIPGSRLVATLSACCGLLFLGVVPVTRALSPTSPFALNSQNTESSLNRVLILNNGDDALLVRIHLIRRASRSIDIQTFIWSNDETGRFLMYELIQAAKRGVRVRIIADHFVSAKDPEIVAFLATAHPNLKIKHYRPAAKRIQTSKLQTLLGAVTRFRSFNQRMHNKVFLIDDEVVITGGRNIENSYFNRSTEMNFRDRDILVMGPAVRKFTTSFADFWACKYAIPSTKLRDVAKLIADKSFPAFKTLEDFDTNGLCKRESRQAENTRLIHHRFVEPLQPATRVEVFVDKPGKNRSLWLRGGGKSTKKLAELAQNANSEILMQSPYFVLDQDTRKLLAKLRRKKPEMHLQVSTNSFGSTDNIMAYSANYKLRSTYLSKLDIAIYEMKPYPAHLRQVFPRFDHFYKEGETRKKENKQKKSTFLCVHAKSAVFDSRIAYIGSYNLDPRSANLNTEVGVLIYDKDIAAALKKTILQDCAPENSWVIAKRPMPLKTDVLNGLIEGASQMAPIDLWPIRNSTSYELRPGMTPLPPGHKDFYEHYKSAGDFPGAPKGVSTKDITTRIYKTLGGVTIPLL